MTGHAIIHSPEGGRDGMCDDAFMWGMWLGRGTAVSNGDNSKKQPIQQQGATERIAGGRMSFLKKS